MNIRTISIATMVIATFLVTLFACKKDAKETNAYNESGWAKVEQKDYAGAIEDFSKAIELEPKRARYYSSRGWAKIELKNYKGAVEDFNKAVELNQKYAEEFGYEPNTEAVKSAEAYYMRGLAKAEDGTKKTVTKKSWEFILSEDDLESFGARANRLVSDDSNFVDGKSKMSGILGNSKHMKSYSRRQFNSLAGVIQIEVVVYSNSDYAKKIMQENRQSATGSQAGVYSTNSINIDEDFGDESFCSQWSGFAPKVWFRINQIIVTVSGGVFLNDTNISLALKIARLQEQKIKRMLR